MGMFAARNPGIEIHSAPMSIKLTCGASTIEIKPAGITMTSPKIAIEGSIAVDVSTDGALKLKGSSAEMTSATTKVEGKTVLLLETSQGLRSGNWVDG